MQDDFGQLRDEKKKMGRRQEPRREEHKAAANRKNGLAAAVDGYGIPLKCRQRVRKGLMRLLLPLRSQEVREWVQGT